MSNTSPQEFVRMPILVEAWRLIPEDLPAIAKWCNGKVKGNSVMFPRIRDKARTLDSQDRNSYAVIGDVIVKSSKGYTLMKGDDFDRQYRAYTKRA